MKNYVEGIKDAIDQMEKPLERLVTEAKNVSEKVISRENFLNTQFSRQLEDLHESQVCHVSSHPNHQSLKNSLSLYYKLDFHFLLTEKIVSTQRSPS